MRRSAVVVVERRLHAQADVGVVDDAYESALLFAVTPAIATT